MPKPTVRKAHLYKEVWGTETPKQVNKNKFKLKNHELIVVF